MKSYTDIEQSKKLAEILPLESADMAWCNNSIKGVNYTDKFSANLYTVKEMQDVFNEALHGWDKYWELIPCWSLAALLDALPQDIEDEQYRKYDLHIHRDLDNTYWLEYKKGVYQSPLYDTYCSEELVDVCVEMLETLTKNGKLCLDVSFATTK